MSGLIGKKVIMTSMYSPTGVKIPCTVIPNNIENSFYKESVFKKDLYKLQTYNKDFSYLDDLRKIFQKENNLKKDIFEKRSIEDYDKENRIFISRSRFTSRWNGKGLIRRLCSSKKCL